MITYEVVGDVIKTCDIRWRRGLISSSNITNKMPTNWQGRRNAAQLKFDPKPAETAFSAAFFSNFDKCRSEVAGVVISGLAAE